MRFKDIKNYSVVTSHLDGVDYAVAGSPLCDLVATFAMYGAKGEVPEEFTAILGVVNPHGIANALKSLTPREVNGLVRSDWAALYRPLVWEEWDADDLVSPKGRVILSILVGIEDKVPLTSLKVRGRELSYHGVAAYSGANSDVLANARALANPSISSKWGICCSNLPIGGIGFVIDGEIRAIFNADVFSWKGEGGTRYMSGSYLPTAHNEVLHWSHPQMQEIITTDSRPVAVWFKSRSTWELAARSLAEELGLKLLEVKGGHTPNWHGDMHVESVEEVDMSVEYVPTFGLDFSSDLSSFDETDPIDEIYLDDDWDEESIEGRSVDDTALAEEIQNILSKMTPLSDEGVKSLAEEGPSEEELMAIEAEQNDPLKSIMDILGLTAEEEDDDLF